MPFDGKNRIKNLFTKYGISNKKILGFLGHSDVVPAGKMWKVEPFDTILKNCYLYGRGICNMKGGIAAFCIAASDRKQESNNLNGPIVILITGDEEILSKEGVKALINRCKE